MSSHTTVGRTHTRQATCAQRPRSLELTIFIPHCHRLELRAMVTQTPPTTTRHVKTHLSYTVNACTAHGDAHHHCVALILLHGVVPSMCHSASRGQELGRCSRCNIPCEHPHFTDTQKHVSDVRFCAEHHASDVQRNVHRMYIATLRSAECVLDSDSDGGAFAHRHRLASLRRSTGAHLVNEATAH